MEADLMSIHKWMRDCRQCSHLRGYSQETPYCAFRNEQIPRISISVGTCEDYKPHSGMHLLYLAEIEEPFK